MKIALPILSLFFYFSLSTFSATAQVGKGDIILEKNFSSYQFFQDDKKLSFRQVLEVMKSNPDAYKYMKSARRASTWSQVTGFAGGFLIGFPLGTAIGGGDPEWEMAAGGAGIMVVSILLDRKFKKQAKLAMDAYNAGND